MYTRRQIFAVSTVGLWLKAFTTRTELQMRPACDQGYQVREIIRKVAVTGQLTSLASGQRDRYRLSELQVPRRHITQCAELARLCGG